MAPQTPIVVIHADESCLGNGREVPSPGGAAALVETRHGSEIVRSDIYISAPDTTNNRMALAGAIATLATLAKASCEIAVVFVSDSQYLIKGMNEWMPAWRARGWKRKGGEIENLALWKELDHINRSFDQPPVWHWVRGHAGHPKNEYANDLAIRAAREQICSDGSVGSAFGQWLARKHAAGLFAGFDPDRHLSELEELAR